MPGAKATAQGLGNMAVGSGVPYSRHTGNGVTTTFAYGFTVLSADDLVATVDGVVTSVTVNNVGNAAGGSVVFATAPAADSDVLLRRVLTAVRLVEYAENGDLLAETLNADLDRLLMLIQSGEADVSRSIRAAIPEELDDLPAAADRAGYYLGFDGTGQPTLLLAATGTAAALASDLASADALKGDAMFTVKRDAAGAVAATGNDWVEAQPLNARADFAAYADASTDDYTRLQAALDEAQLRRGKLVLPPPATPGDYYIVSQPLVITNPLALEGMLTHGVTIIGESGAFSAGQYILDFNCAAVDNVEHLSLENITIRSLDGVPNGIRVKNASYLSVKNVRVFGTANGVDIEGTRCFSNDFEGLVCYGITGTSVRFMPNFSGGGQFKFDRCSFSGAYGVTVDSTAATDGLTFDTCNWEQCTTRAVKVDGTVQGCNLEGVRGEGGGGHGFEFAPTSGNEVTGLSINGMSFYSGTVAATPIILGTSGGTGGKVRGFAIVGNRVGYAATSHFVELNAEAQSGLIAGNYLNENTPSVVSAHRAGVVVMANENGAGRLPDMQHDTPVTVTYSASMTPNASAGRLFVITPTNTTAFTINAPTNTPPSGTTLRISIRIRNGSGGALGTITWDAVFKMAAWTSPANGYSRTISFDWNGTNWVEASRTTADVPN